MKRIFIAGVIIGALAAYNRYFNGEEENPAAVALGRKGGGGVMDPALEQSLKALESAAHLLPEDQEWIPLMRDVLQLPVWMLPAVQYVIGSGEWRESRDPLSSVSEGAFIEAARMGLSAKPAVRNASG
jgi:hypothetical protein